MFWKGSPGMEFCMKPKIVLISKLGLIFKKIKINKRYWADAILGLSEGNINSENIYI